MTKTKDHLSPEMRSRLNCVLRCKENRKCADCDASRPRWVSFITPQVRIDRQLGVLICCECAQHHHFEIGPKRCLIKCLDVTHEWEEQDTAILEYSGNAFVNSIYEGRLKESRFNKHAKFDDDEDSSNHRARFIKKKYNKRKFYDEVVYHEKMIELLLGKRHVPTVQDDKRHSFRRAQSISNCGSRSSVTNAPQRKNLRSFFQRSASNPDMGPVSAKKTDRKPHTTHRPPLRSSSTKSCQLRRLRSQSSCRSLGLLESPKIDMRNRRLNAMACIYIDLPTTLMMTEPNCRRGISQAA